MLGILNCRKMKRVSYIRVYSKFVVGVPCLWLIFDLDSYEECDKVLNSVLFLAYFFFFPVFFYLVKKLITDNCPFEECYCGDWVFFCADDLFIFPGMCNGFRYNILVKMDSLAIYAWSNIVMIFRKFFRCTKYLLLVLILCLKWKTSLLDSFSSYSFLRFG